MEILAVEFTREFIRKKYWRLTSAPMEQIKLIAIANDNTAENRRATAQRLARKKYKGF